MKVVRLSALSTGRLYPPGNIPGTHFCYRMSRTQGHSAVGRIMSMKNSSGTNGYRTCDHPACSAVSQRTALARARHVLYIIILLRLLFTLLYYLHAFNIVVFKDSVK